MFIPMYVPIMSIIYPRLNQNIIASNDLIWMEKLHSKSLAEST